MEGSWVRSRTKKRKSRRTAAAARLRRAVLQQQSRARHDQAGTSGTNKEGRRRGAASTPPGTAARRKYRELQTLVPGGEGLRADRLLLRTAGYIMHLRRQVHLLRVLSELYNAP